MKRIVIVVGLLSVLGACSKENNVSIDEEGTPSETQELADCSSVSPPAGMVVTGRADGTCHFIDEREVSQGEYASFLELDTDSSTLPSECDYKESFEPSADCDPSSIGASEPQVCVDWCDASAFCNSLNKTLCPGGFSDKSDREQSTWYAACSGAEDSDYPYGNDYDRDLCNGRDQGENRAGPSDGFKGCVAENGAINLSGNVAEWTAACDDQSGADDLCLFRGGAYTSAEESLRCSAASSRERASPRFDIGFRCCKAAE